ncbi:tRNA uridine(34) 5-carboxymethylaminomethyl modification radical SAM/GNAT enzyme Elp3 [Patescibacteria group bacterium]|nr:tRNA uridine(34) 5-carboxymethylaminomethyl modification radical SAM/GNAT enzyme Elp3 [Patescibacteria group bacterium]
MKNIDKIIISKIIKANPKDYSSFLVLKKRFSGEFNLPPLNNATLIKVYRQLKLSKSEKNKIKKLLAFLTKRRTRTLSGVTPLTVLTKPYPCPGKCIYCPAEPKMPKSYLSNEPAAMRAVLNKFDPVKQVKMRIKALEANGHEVDKIELLILGGCFNAYTKKYQKTFIKNCFATCNNFNKKTKPVKTLEQTFKQNEKTKYRIIGVTIETRPDMINEQEIKWFRELGITRVQFGVQHLNDKILAFVKRGHTVKQTIQATKLLKRAGFKIDYHLMPNLPNSTPAKDLQMFKKIFTDKNFQPDQIKIYPTVVNKYAPLYRWYKSGKHKPYSPKQLLNLLLKIKQTVPYYVRINRLIRDIPKQSIAAGNKITNLRQLLQEKMQKQEKKCKCIRCREAKEDITNLKKAKLFTEKYRASDGWEYFISYESPKRDKLYSFIRFRVNDEQNNFIPELKNASLVRELHTYGQLIPVKSPLLSGKRGINPHLTNAIQHTGFGKRLMKIAEDLTYKHGLKKIAVISGIGVRPYYQKLGYCLEETYMIKYLH